MPRSDVTVSSLLKNLLFVLDRESVVVCNILWPSKKFFICAAITTVHFPSNHDSMSFHSIYLLHSCRRVVVHDNINHQSLDNDDALHKQQKTTFRFDASVRGDTRKGERHSRQHFLCVKKKVTDWIPFYPNFGGYAGRSLRLQRLSSQWRWPTPREAGPRGKWILFLRRACVIHF